jgi:hypothetical protein
VLTRRYALDSVGRLRLTTEQVQRATALVEDGSLDNCDQLPLTEIRGKLEDLDDVFKPAHKAAAAAAEASPEAAKGLLFSLSFGVRDLRITSECFRCFLLFVISGSRVSVFGVLTHLDSLLGPTAKDLARTAELFRQKAEAAKYADFVTVEAGKDAVAVLKQATSDKGFKVGGKIHKARLFVFDPPWNCTAKDDNPHDQISDETLRDVFQGCNNSDVAADDARLYVFLKFQDIGKWTELLEGTGWKVAKHPYLFVSPGGQTPVRPRPSLCLV